MAEPANHSRREGRRQSTDIYSYPIGKDIPAEDGLHNASLHRLFEFHW